MEEKREESVEELAEKLESKLAGKEGADDWEEIDFEDRWETLLSEDEYFESLRAEMFQGGSLNKSPGPGRKGNGSDGGADSPGRRGNGPDGGADSPRQKGNGPDGGADSPRRRGNGPDGRADSPRQRKAGSGREADENRYGENGADWEADGNRYGEAGAGWEADENRYGENGAGWEADENRNGKNGADWEADEYRNGEAGAGWEADENRYGENGVGWETDEYRNEEAGEAGAGWEADEYRDREAGARRKTNKARYQEKPSGEDFPEEEYLEDDWEDEEIAPMKPGIVVAAFAGVIVLAVIICAVLWHFTHLDKGDGQLQSSGAAGMEGSAPSLAEKPDGSLAAGPDNGEAPVSLPETDPIGTPEPAATPALATAPPAPTTSPAQESTAVQEPVSGTTAMEFTQDEADVTPKDVVNLRSAPSTLDGDNIVAQAKNGDVLSRTGVNGATGWTRIEYNGETVYAVSQYLTTDLSYRTPVQEANPNRVNTMDGRIILFTDCNDNMTPKEYVNLRTEPSTSEGESTVRCQVSNGEVVHRTGYSPDSGWSRVEYNGEVLYVVSSLMNTVE